MQHGAVHISSLPESVLGYILSLAGREAGPAATLVCKQWRALFYQQPTLWDSLTLRAPLSPAGHFQQLLWLAGTLALVRRVAPLVRCAELVLSTDTAEGGRAAPHDALSKLLAAFDPAVLASLATVLRIAPMTDMQEVVAELARFTRLESFSMDCPVSVFLSPCLKVLTQAAGAGSYRLQNLELKTLIVMDYVVEDAAAHLSLTRLVLWSNSSLPLLQPLTALRQLKELEVCEMQSTHTGLQLLPVACFPAAQELAFFSACFQLEAGGSIQSAPGVPCGMMHLRKPASYGGSWVLALSALALCAEAPLLAVLRALGMEGSRLTRLSLQECQLSPAGCALVVPGDSNGSSRNEAGDSSRSCLPALRRLIMRSNRFAVDGGVAWDAESDQERAAVKVLEQLLPALPALEVHLLNTPLSSGLPTCLQQLSGITALQLSVCRLRQLPEGAYLQGLRILALDGNEFRALPPALAAATRLEMLVLGDNRQLVLTPADLERVLAALPSLHVLQLPDRVLQGGMAELMAQRLPRLHVDSSQAVLQYWRQ